MVGMENKDLVHRTGDNRVDLVFLCRHRKAHVQEVLCITQVIAWINHRLTN